ncbi:hypothetical protein ABT324_02995 [Saccharopolyspora sp. NPDC000359]|uniref:hypothetical protein n=1 Tax=Saccharopolyspora sp. NPDC000359 TaxID=3154251 RepID=UPI00332E0C80
MMFVELFAPKGALSSDQRRRVAELLGALDRFVPDEDRHAGISEVFGALFHVVVHESAVWVTGGEVLEPGAPARFVVRVHVPGPWRKDMSEYVVSHTTEAVAAVAGPEAAVQVHVLGVPEGGIGLNGQVATSTRIVEMMGEPYLADLEAGKAVRDPLCGVIVPLNEDAITLEVDGAVHGFCCAGCREEYVAKLGLTG